ncbi:phosphoadenylyl-sulfate reductase [Oceaniglobus ichthyenteri]|uniref:phosphoadenylyl-sulfate reductase n=1 Tax=Oceaniglobus ichthyenteri TaxID=2136177 RepID=UPI000D365D77|nr:phosphoadenylyl-sulfate reductase [Oceaniglobus ichthyenteri]
MPLESPLPPLAERVAALNARFAHHSAHDILRAALNDPFVGRLAMVSSFGAESVALLHILSTIDRTVPVIFLDTEMLFHETLTYQQQVAQHLRLRDIRIIRPARGDIFRQDSDGLLHQSNPDACCTLRKTVPMANAIEQFDGWITGRKRFHGGARQSLPLFEVEGPRIKVNPLAHWARTDVSDYITNNRLPRHPLVAKGFGSVGCAPCTTRVTSVENPRAGRWRGQEKTECGIHFPNGQAVQT